MPLDMKVGLGLGDVVFDGDPAPHPPPKGGKRGTQTFPEFLAHVYCGQTGGWIKLPLGTKI